MDIETPIQNAGFLFFHRILNLGFKKSVSVAEILIIKVIKEFIINYLRKFFDAPKLAI